MPKIRRHIFVSLFFSIVAYSASGQHNPGGLHHDYRKHLYDAINYKVEMDIFDCHKSPFPRTFSAKMTLTVKADSILSQIMLNAANSSLEIDSVGMAGTAFTHFADTLKIQLGRTYLPGENLDVKICYRHKNVADQAFYVSSGYVFTDFPPEGARKVFPCRDRPSDKATWEIIAKVPLTARLGATGKLADSVVSADTITYRWISENPVATYLVCLSSKDGFQIQKSWWHNPSIPSDSTPVRIYYKPGENLATINNLLTPITNFFSTKFGRYPFEKIGFAIPDSSFPWGGMENQTMVNLMPGGYSDGNLIAHEHSHQWFGDLITCGTWADIWLNESFGTYCQNLWVEHNSDYETYKAGMNRIANYYLEHNPGLPLYNPEWAIHTPSSNLLYSTALVYDKGACVLFQLRYVVGDALFSDLMKAYATDTNFMFKNAVTREFITKANQVSGQNLNWFFDSWVYSPNHPVYENSYDIIQRGTGKWMVKLRIRQTQKNTGFFRMPVEIGIKFNNGSDTVVKVINEVNPQEFELTFQSQPIALTFDPARKILLKQATTLVGIKPENEK